MGASSCYVLPWKAKELAPMGRSYEARQASAAW